jgi:TonB family protein
MQPERALANYTQAWTAAKRIAGKPSGPSATELVFGKPVLLQVVRPEGWDRNASKPVDTLEVRTVVIEATIDAAGRAIDAKIVDDSGDARRADRTLKALTETARYRPRFENGEPVVTQGVRFEQPWILELPKEEPAKPGS